MCTRRSDPLSCFIHCLHIVAPDGRGQTASGEAFLSVLFLLVAEDFASAKATKGQWKQTKSAIAPFDTFGCTPMLLDFIVAGNFVPSCAVKVSYRCSSTIF